MNGVIDWELEVEDEGLDLLVGILLHQKSASLEAQHLGEGRV